MSDLTANKEIEKQLRDLVSNRKAAVADFSNQMDSFFDAHRRRPILSQKAYEDISAKYVLDDSDFDEYEETDEKPIKIKRMSFTSQKIFSKKPQPKPKYDEDEIAESRQKQKEKQQTFVEKPQIKPILIDRDVQCPKSHLSPTFNCPIQIIPEQVQKPMKTYNTQSTNTKDIRKRNEATETEALLPQYEAKCMELIQSIINEAPLTANSLPSEEALGDILIQFVNQIIRDADKMESAKPQTNASSQSGADSVQQRGLNKIIADAQNIANTRYQTASIQSDAIDTMDNGTQTQGKISLRSLESKQNVSLPPQHKEKAQLALASTIFGLNKPIEAQESEKGSVHVSLTPPQAQFNIFQFPPPLTSEEPKPVLISGITSPITSFIDDGKPKKPAQQNLQLETLVSKNIDVVPQRPSQARAVDDDTKPKVLIPEPDEKPIKPKPQQKNIINLEPLPQSIIQLPDDLGTISVLNLSSDENLLDSDEGELSSISGSSVSTTVTSGSSGTTSTVNTSTIERLLDSDTDSISQSGNSFNLNDMSSGEVKSSLLDTDEVSSSIFNSSFT